MYYYKDKNNINYASDRPINNYSVELILVVTDFRVIKRDEEIISYIINKINFKY